MARQHVAHHCQNKWHREHRREPKPASHVPEFAALPFLLAVESRLKSHAAYWTIAGSVPQDLRMHRASPLRRTFRWRREWLQGHATLRARTRTRLPNFRMHWTGVDVFLRCRGNSVRRFTRRKEGLRILDEAIAAASAAKRIFPTISLMPILALRRHRHSTHGVFENFVRQCAHATCRLSILSISAKYSGCLLNFAKHSFEQK